MEWLIGNFSQAFPARQTIDEQYFSVNNKQKSFHLHAIFTFLEVY